MTSDEDPKSPAKTAGSGRKPDPSDDRKARLAAQLRANLRRRKEQARAGRIVADGGDEPG